ncbi:MAG: ABC transporter substrate-binding protein [Acidimicrobiales bacterium]|nr:ABC transporter substrate-binding protein [Acidimicrobiales bacterium]
MRLRRLLVVGACVALLAGACSSRGEDDAGGGSGGTDTTDTTAANAGEGGESEAFGTLDSPCGPAADGTPADDTSGGDEGETQGIGADSIAVGTVADPGFSGQPGLNQEIFDAGEAFVTWCNDQGGINGRQLDLTQYDAAISEYQGQMEQACDQEFAIVGDGAVQDNLWSTVGAACGLIDIAGFSVTAEKAGSHGPDVWQETRAVQPVPNPADQYPVGAIRLLDEEFPGAIDHVGIIYGDIATTREQKDKIAEAVESQGGTVVLERASNILGEANWAPFAQAIKEAGVEWLTVVGSGDATGQLQQALVEIDYQPDVTLLEANYYDPIYVDAAGAAADGTFVRLVFTPFEEAADNPATQKYIDLVEAVDGKVALLGAQSMSGWLLFAQSVKECDEAGTLTRSCVLETAGSVTEWDAGGLHAPADPSTNSAVGCVMIVQIQDGEFVRHTPDEGFACGDDDVVDLTGDFSTAGG